MSTLKFWTLKIQRQGLVSEKVESFPENFIGDKTLYKEKSNGMSNLCVQNLRLLCLFEENVNGGKLNMYVGMTEIDKSSLSILKSDSPSTIVLEIENSNFF